MQARTENFDVKVWDEKVHPHIEVPFVVVKSRDVEEEAVSISSEEIDSLIEALQQAKEYLQSKAE